MLYIHDIIELHRQLMGKTAQEATGLEIPLISATATGPDDVRVRLDRVDWGDPKPIGHDAAVNVYLTLGFTELPAIGSDDPPRTYEMTSQIEGSNELRWNLGLPVETSDPSVIVAAQQRAADRQRHVVSRSRKN